MGDAADDAYDSWVRSELDHAFPIRRRRMPKEQKWKNPLRTWQVTMKDNSVHSIDAHYMFDNASQQDGQPGGQGLVFRRCMKGDDHFTVVAAFNRDMWSHYKEIV